MTRARTVAGVAALVGAALLVLPVSAVSGKAPPTPQLAKSVSQGALDRVTPPKSAAEAAARRPAARPMSVGVSAGLKATTDRHMSADPALKALLGGTSYKVVKEGTWSRAVSTERIGVVREIQLAKPVDMAMRGWPVMYWDDARDTYQRFSYNAAWANVSRVTVFVDDTAGVVGLTPDENAVLTQGPGNEWIATLPKGTPK
ncbi:hypothetical protein SAMN05421812_117123 [Asanoa hainanensis]|uniref:Uncharacterized protein n=1 Tax=Asanoa hainanensis TaxID=560556 RepID=A0A239PDA5_9ACTN|nr:hypothetical protein [Asanoa hainanensis]SNT64594.1 hypothetical protein SAMN05421812_117123 [Asanoa hainanensis]